MNGSVSCPNCFQTLVEPRPAAPPPSQGVPRRRPLFGGQATPPTPEAPEPARPTEEKPSATCRWCSFSLPVGWTSVPTTCIAAAGSRATGKSIYLAVMIRQLEHLATSLGLEVRPANQATDDVFQQKYVTPLYVEREMMPPTARAGANTAAYQREPMVFELATRWGQRHHLVIRDVAGEDLEKTDTDEKHLAFFSHADAIFFLFDPLKIPEIRNKLRMQVAAQLQGENPLTVLNRTLSLVHGPVPRLGVIMSKFDVMQALRTSEHSDDWTAIMGNPGAGINRDPGPLGHPAEVRGDIVHYEVRSLLMMLDASALMYRAQRVGGGGAPGGHQFFAVSALGNPPTGEVLNTRGIAPFRVLDPLRWALAGTGVLE